MTHDCGERARWFVEHYQRMCELYNNRDEHRKGLELARWFERLVRCERIDQSDLVGLRNATESTHESSIGLLGGHLKGWAMIYYKDHIHE
jgi:hypothetical protein